MKVAIPVWEDRVSSVLDFSQQLVVVELNDAGEASRVQIALSDQSPFVRLAKLRELGIDVLICGAVSQPLASVATAQGIQLLPYVTGTVDDVLKAYQTGRLDLPEFRLPGWWPGARRGFGRWGRRCRVRRGKHRQIDGLDSTRRGTADGNRV